MTQGRSANDVGPQNGNGMARQLPEPEPHVISAPVPEPQPVICGPIRRRILIINPRGLHPRIIDLFTRTAKRFASEVTIWNGEARGNGKDVWDLISLLVMPDSEVTLEVDGPDAESAIGPLSDILAASGGEDYSFEDNAGEGI